MCSVSESVVYRYYGFDKFECFTPDHAKPFRSCPEDVGAVRSVHVGWANAIFVTEASIAELRGLGGPRQVDGGATLAVLGIRGHWIVLGVKTALLGRGCKTLRVLGPLQAAALGPTLALLLRHRITGLLKIDIEDLNNHVPLAKMLVRRQSSFLKATR
ncbi:hypothetical protein MTO96_051839 [Rhipicephalus appendiculatus]